MSDFTTRTAEMTFPVRVNSFISYHNVSGKKKVILLIICNVALQLMVLS